MSFNTQRRGPLRLHHRRRSHPQGLLVRLFRAARLVLAALARPVGRTAPSARVQALRGLCDDGREYVGIRSHDERGQGTRPGAHKGPSLRLCRFSICPRTHRPSLFPRQYIVRATWSPEGRHVATAGYDKQLLIHRVSLSSPSTSGAPALLDGEAPDPLATCPDVSLTQAHRIAMRTNPEAAVWLPDGSELVWTARDDHLMHYVRVPPEGDGPEGVKQLEWEESVQSLNPNGDAFVSFSMCVPPVFHFAQRLLTRSTRTQPLNRAASDPSAPLAPDLDPIRPHPPLPLPLVDPPPHDPHAGVPVRLLLAAARVATGRERSSRQRRGRRRARGGPARERPCLCGRAWERGAPEEGDEGGEGGGEALRSERARLRREADKGSSVVRDVEVLVEEDSAGVPKRWRIVSCGFDKTVKLIE